MGRLGKVGKEKELRRKEGEGKKERGEDVLTSILNLLHGKAFGKRLRSLEVWKSHICMRFTCYM